MNKLAKAGVAALAGALLFSACGAPPGQETVTETVVTENGGTTVVADGNFIPCIVSDAGGFNDRSFNQSAFEGVQAAAQQLGIGNFPNVQSTDLTQFAPNLEALVGQNCTLIVATGFQFNDAVQESATSHPAVHYLLVDSELDSPLENVKPVIFDTAQAAFLAGYVAAAYSARPGGANHVGTFGGMAFPTVTDFMDGFYQGVEYYNQQNNANVQVTGWDGTDGSFTGGFEANQTALSMAQGIINQGVDVILPVGGPIYQSAVAAIADSGREVALIGVDQDVFYTDESTQDIILTSILKNINVTVKESIVDAADGTWDNTPYVGTLANDGVGLAPFHNFDSEVSQEVRDQIARLTQDIIDGNVVVHSSFTN